MSHASNEGVENTGKVDLFAAKINMFANLDIFVGHDLRANRITLQFWLFIYLAIHRAIKYFMVNN